MKNYKMLSLTLAVLLAAALLWYGTIALKANSRPPVLTPVAGDDTALEGITIEGMLVDLAHTQGFTLKNGKITASTQLNPKSSYAELRHFFCNLEAYPAGELSQPELLRQDEVSQLWQMSAQKVHLYAEVLGRVNGFSYQSVTIDTGIELPAKDILFNRTAKADGTNAGSWYLADNREFWENYGTYGGQSAVQQIGSSIYVGLNLPGGGVNVYEITQPVSEWKLENDLLREKEQQRAERRAEDMTITPENIDQARLVHSFAAAEMLSVSEILPLEENLLLIGQSYNQAAKQVNLNAWLCNQELKVLGTVNLAQLPASEKYLEEKEKYQLMIIPGDQPTKQENSLKLTVNVFHRAFGGDVLHMAAVITAGSQLTVEKYLFPGEAYAPGLQMKLLSERPRDILAVQQNETGEKTALVYALLQNAGETPDTNLYLDVWQGQTLLYTGALQSDWMDDNHSKLVGINPAWGFSGQRYYSFPAQKNMISPGYMLNWYQPQLDAYGNIL